MLPYSEEALCLNAFKMRILSGLTLMKSESDLKKPEFVPAFIPCLKTFSIELKSFRMYSFLDRLEIFKISKSAYSLMIRISLQLQ